MKGTPRSTASTINSPRARQSLTIKTASHDDKRTNFDKSTPKRTPSPRVQSRKVADIQACEVVLFDQLVSLMKVIMKANLTKTAFDANVLNEHIQTRSAESVNEGINKIVSKLELMQGPCTSHRLTASSQLFGMLMDDIKMIVFNDDKHKINTLRSEQNMVKEEANRVHEALTLKIAKKDQQISTLEYELAMSETKNKTLSKALELLEKELEKSQHSVTETHQRAVELRMQGWDFKHEVDRRSDKILTSVSSRMGFVPAGIQKQVSQLKVLKPPGDPDYDLVRSSARQRGSGGGSKKKKSSSRGISGRAVADNPLLQSLLSGSPAGTLVNMSKYAGSTPSQSVDGDERPTVDISAVAATPGATSSSSSSAAAALSPKSAAAVFARTSDQSFQQYLLNAAEGDWKLMQALSPKSISKAINESAAAAHDHRRLSASSNASGYTDRRSSTSSSTLFNNTGSIRSLDVNHSHVSSASDDEIGDSDAGEGGPEEHSHSLAFSHRGGNTTLRASKAGIADVSAEVDFSVEEEEQEEDEDEGGADDELFDSKMYDDDDASSSSSDEEEVNTSNNKSGEKAAVVGTNNGRYSRELKDTAGARALRTASGGSQSPGRKTASATR